MKFYIYSPQTKVLALTLKGVAFYQGQGVPLKDMKPEVWLPPSMAQWPSNIYLNSLNISFSICEIGIMIYYTGLFVCYLK